MLHIQSRHRQCSKLWVCVYHQPLIYGLICKLFLGRKKSARFNVDCRCYFKRFNLLWKTCLFNGFSIKRMREHTKPGTPMCSSLPLLYRRVCFVPGAGPVFCCGYLTEVSGSCLKPAHMDLGSGYGLY